MNSSKSIHYPASQPYTGNNGILTELATSYYNTRDLCIRERFAQEAQDFVTNVARKAKNKGAYVTELEDLVSSGNIGLLDALEHFDPRKNNNFELYAIKRVRGAILDGMRQEDKEKRFDRSRIKVIQNAADNFYKEHGRVFTFRECLGILKNKHLVCGPLIFPKKGPLSKQYRWFYTMAITSRYNEVSLDIESEEECNPPIFSAARKIDEPLYRVQRDELLRQFELDLLALPRRFRKIVRDRILLEETMKLLGKTIGVSESAISRFLKKILQQPFFGRTKEYINMPEK